MELTQSEQQKEKRMKKKKMKIAWRIMGQHQMVSYSHYRAPRRRQRERAEILFEEVMAENSLRKETDTQIQKYRGCK